MAMKFVLNTSFNPHFCLLLDSDNNLKAEAHWEIPREDGIHIWDFLKTNLPSDVELTFIGGVSGPGSFSSLRAGGAILNALAFRFNLPIHQARADQVIQDHLKDMNQDSTSFFLNSFGSRIFTVDHDKLRPIEISDESLDKSASTITSWLPPNKAKNFNNSIKVDPLGPQQTIINTLENTTGQKVFIPDYEYPAVQS